MGDIKNLLGFKDDKLDKQGRADAGRGKVLLKMRPFDVMNCFLAQ